MAQVGRRHLRRDKIAYRYQGEWIYIIRTVDAVTLRPVSSVCVRLDQMIPDYQGEYLEPGYFHGKGLLVLDRDRIERDQRSPNAGEGGDS